MKPTDFAFPVRSYDGTPVSFGLKARDYIAIQAMQGILSGPSAHEHNMSPDAVARLAYSCADVMIETSEGKNEV